MFLLRRCGGLRCGIAALHGDLTWMSMDRYGLGCLFWMRIWVVEWRLLESGFSGLWGFTGLGRCWRIVGGVAASLLPLWIADQVRNDGLGCCLARTVVS